MLKSKPSTNWHNISALSTARILNTDFEKGLSENEAKNRQKIFGPNSFPEEKQSSAIRIFLEQFKSPLVYILLVAGIITAILKDRTETIVIFGTVFLNAIIGYLQEYQTAKTLLALKKVVKHEAKVLREGSLRVVDAKELVPGDIVVLHPGDKVPADGRIIGGYGLKINEMVLTGEWFPRDKRLGILAIETPMADRENMVYLGTTVESGKGKVIVTAIGWDTEMGQVAEIVKEVKKEKTPYQEKLVYLSRSIGLIMALIAIVIFINGLLVGFSFEEMLTIAVAVAVAAVPEGLLVATTVILAVGMERILKKRGLVRKLVAAETLGATSVICTDKTGTLTEGKMKVKKVLLPETIFKKGRQNKYLEFLTLKIAALTSEAFIENPKGPKEKWILRGTPTEKALLEALHGEQFNRYHNHEKYQELESGKIKIDELLFNPINKFSAVLYQENEKEYNLYLYGAPEKVLEFTRFFYLKKKHQQLTKKDFAVLEKELTKLAKTGLRVIATAYKQIIKSGPVAFPPRIKEELNDLTLSGFITIEDPIRQEVKEVISHCRQMGIKPIIVTGDHQLTAKAVAEEIGFGKLGEENILEGRELDTISDEQLKNNLEKIQIYARVEPKHKLRIIKAWQEKGEVVAMTGDGINDTPALKEADVGVALGSGTEAAKEASDLILLTDSFSVIVSAIEEGRAMLDNIRKVITYLLSDSFTEVILVGASIIFSWPIPVTATQILWVNLIEDVLPSFALAFEPKENDLLKRKPKKREVPLISYQMKILIFVIGIVTDLFLLTLFFLLQKYSGYEIQHIRTIIFVGLAFDSLFFILSCRSLRKNIWQINPFSNIMIVLSWIFALLMLVSAIYFPPFQGLLKTEPLNLFDWQLVLVLGLLNIVLIEMVKRYFIKKAELTA